MNIKITTTTKKIANSYGKSEKEENEYHDHDHDQKDLQYL
jgi:hypothetical protein